MVCRTSDIDVSGNFSRGINYRDPSWEDDDLIFSLDDVAHNQALEGKR